MRGARNLHDCANDVDGEVKPKKKFKQYPIAY